MTTQLNPHTGKICYVYSPTEIDKIRHEARVDDMVRRGMFFRSSNSNDDTVQVTRSMKHKGMTNK